MRNNLDRKRTVLGLQSTTPLSDLARVAVSAHRLRHSCLTNLVRRGHDLVLVAEIAGHKRIETTRRYSLPSEHDRQAAMESLRMEY